MANNPELVYEQVQDPFQGDGQIQASIDDLITYAEEVVSAAAYNEEVVEIIESVVLDDSPRMSPDDFKKLKARLEDEYGLWGDDLTRALYRCTVYIKKINGISRVID